MSYFCRLVTFCFVFLLGISCAGNSSVSRRSPDAQRKEASKAYSYFEGITGDSSSSKTSSVSLQENELSENVPSLQKNGYVGPVILVMPAQNVSGVKELEIIQKNPLSRAAMDEINHYLTAQQYEVKSLEGQSEFDDLVQIQQDISEIENDLAYLAGLSMGADIYIKFAGNFALNQSIVELSAYETATARLLGTQSASVGNVGHDKGEQIRSIREATKKAMPGLEKIIRAYWAKDYRDGNRYRVLLKMTGEFDEDELEDLQDDIKKLMKTSFKQIQMNSVTDKTIDLVVFADATSFADGQDIYSYIRKHLKEKVKVKKLSITRKLILVEVK